MKLDTKICHVSVKCWEGFQAQRSKVKVAARPNALSDWGIRINICLYIQYYHSTVHCWKTSFSKQTVTLVNNLQWVWSTRIPLLKWYSHIPDLWGVLHKQQLLPPTFWQTHCAAACVGYQHWILHYVNDWRPSLTGSITFSMCLSVCLSVLKIRHFDETTPPTAIILMLIYDLLSWIGITISKISDVTVLVTVTVSVSCIVWRQHHLLVRNCTSYAPTQHIRQLERRTN